MLYAIGTVVCSVLLGLFGYGLIVVASVLGRVAKDWGDG